MPPTMTVGSKCEVCGTPLLPRTDPKNPALVIGWGCFYESWHGRDFRLFTEGGVSSLPEVLDILARKRCGLEGEQ